MESEPPFFGRTSKEALKELCYGNVFPCQTQEAFYIGPGLSVAQAGQLHKVQQLSVVGTRLRK